MFVSGYRDITQHAPDGADLIAIGEVLAGRHRSRRSDEEIIVFDNSELSIQDLYIARHFLAKRGHRTRNSDEDGITPGLWGSLGTL
ncbi:hypothetical protein [Microvirga arabica]|uniref:hypothetical protein n=1 Tax=Microvirga arabica TaxID=1128671 RepID=UPI0028B00C97|nr:hypothetical protein [Microvirga arabica]